MLQVVAKLVDNKYGLQLVAGSQIDLNLFFVS